MRIDIAVIGVGMIGAAALRALSEAGAGELLGIGPAEPADLATAEGPFASHYDHGRITRVSDPDLIWATLAQRSIAAYPTIAERGGVAFHYPVGHLRLGMTQRESASPGTKGEGPTTNRALRSSPTGRPSSLVPGPSSGVDSDTDETGLDLAWTRARALGVPIERLAGAALAARFGEVQFPDGAEALIEHGGAGWVDPRAMVAAQLAAAQARVATVLRAAAAGLRREGGAYLIETSDGRRITAERVLVSADASSVGLLRPLLGRTLDLYTHAYTVVYAEVGAAQLATYAATPTLIWPLPEHPFLSSIYTTSAATLPDGRGLLKIGGVPRRPMVLRTPDDWRGWFRGPGRADEVAALQGVLREIYPRLDIKGWGWKTCANSYTAHGRPYVELSAEGLALCTGGCGAAAKSSEAIGRLGAELLLAGRWEDALPEGAFRAAWAAGG